MNNKPKTKKILKEKLKELESSNSSRKLNELREFINSNEYQIDNKPFNEENYTRLNEILKPDSIESLNSPTLKRKVYMRKIKEKYEKYKTLKSNTAPNLENKVAKKEKIIPFAYYKEEKNYFLLNKQEINDYITLMDEIEKMGYNPPKKVTHKGSIVYFPYWGFSQSQEEDAHYDLKLPNSKTTKIFIFPPGSKLVNDNK